MGDNYPLRATDRGFETALTIRGGGLGQPSDPIENQRRYTDPLVFRNNGIEQAKGYCTNVFFDGALEFIRDAQRANRPFFAYIALNAAERNDVAVAHPALVEQLRTTYKRWFR